MTPSPQDGSGRYLATERLGEGGTAEVWRAWDRHSERWCALKVLFKRFAEKKSARRRFIEEGRMVIRLNHRNVIEAWDLVEDAVQPFLVMEIAEGGSLRDWVRRHGPMPPRLAVDAAIQISKGIGAAHEMGVIHRDVKPHNILLTRNGLCKVTDFGIAQLIRQDGTTDVPDWTKTHLNESRSIAGTRGYMAPEQRTNGLAADQRTDVYGIGATFYTLLTGRVDTNLFAVDQDPGLMEGVHPHLVPVVVQATKFRAEERYQNVRDLRRALFDTRDLLPSVPPGSPGLAPQLAPEVSGPNDSRYSDPSTHHSGSTSGGFGSLPPGSLPPRSLPPGSLPPGSLPPGAPPVPGAPIAQHAVEPGRTPMSSRSSRPRTNLILSDARDEDVRISNRPRQRTRPIIVAATLLGILVCGLTLDKLWVATAKGSCARAQRALLVYAMRNPAVTDEAAVDTNLDQQLKKLVATQSNPRETVLAGRRYLQRLESLERRPAPVLRASKEIDERLSLLERRLERWWRRAQFPGLVVSLRLETHPPEPPRPRK